jgi:hypothetical protein
MGEWVIKAMPWPLYPVKDTQYPLYRWEGGPQGHCECVCKISHLPGLDPWIVHTTVSHNTNYASSLLPNYTMTNLFLPLPSTLQQGKSVFAVLDPIHTKG